MSGWRRDFSARGRESWSRREGTREAFNAVRAMSAGRTKEEARDLLAAGLEARGVTPPAGPVLDYLAGQAMAGGDCPGELGLAAHGLTVLADLGAHIVRETRQALWSGVRTSTSTMNHCSLHAIARELRRTYSSTRMHSNGSALRVIRPAHRNSARYSSC